MATAPTRRSTAESMMVLFRAARKAASSSELPSPTIAMSGTGWVASMGL